VTLFLTTLDAAFTDLNATRPELFTAVTTSAELLTTVLSYHVLPDLVFLPADFAGKNFVATAATLKIGANVADDAVTISSGLLQSSTVTASITITAGIIHQVDQVCRIFNLTYRSSSHHNLSLPLPRRLDSPSSPEHSPANH
jgi:uncharacterized surface protein with fasciclin (FAS1) repeats